MKNTNYVAAAENQPQLDLSFKLIESGRWPTSGRWPLDPYSVANILDWHVVHGIGDWDFARVLGDYKASLRYSERCITGGKPLVWTAVFFMSPKMILTFSRCLGQWEVQLWCDSLEEGQRVFERLRSRYLKAKKESAKEDQVWIITFGKDGIGKCAVEFDSSERDERDLALHYGNDFPHWHHIFVGKLVKYDRGLTILEGQSGTGKTSYLRHIIHTLRGTHRFYYLPLNVCPLLAEPSAVDFWLRENRLHAPQHSVVIIEDAERLLMERAADNQDLLSNLLNMTDGFLGDFLKMHIICTINAKTAVDPAILRPGRLLASHTFFRLSGAQAQALAAAKGLSLQAQETYSLAEIYNQHALARSKQQTTAVTGFNVNH